MEFIKKLFSKTSETFRKLIKKFPVTLAIIVFATLFMTIDINQDVQIFDKIMLFSTVFAVESFFTEVCIYEKKNFRIIGYLASALIAIGFTVLVLGGVTIYKDTISRILLGYLIILFMIAIYKIIKEKNILILDDVYTTGATCNECARILKTAFPNKIGVITIAKDYEKT